MIDDVIAWCEASGLDFEIAGNTCTVVLPGEHKLRTTCSLVAGEHSLSINAFVARHPDENVEAVHRWLLERNRRLFAVAYAIDQLGDIYLVGRIPAAAVTPEILDQVMGAALSEADGSFSDGFSTTVLPVAMAIGKNHIGTMAGKLNGEMTATGPSG